MPQVPPFPGIQRLDRFGESPNQRQREKDANRHPEDPPEPIVRVKKRPTRWASHPPVLVWRMFLDLGAAFPAGHPLQHGICLNPCGSQVAGVGSQSTLTTTVNPIRTASRNSTPNPIIFFFIFFAPWDVVAPVFVLTAELAPTVSFDS